MRRDCFLFLIMIVVSLASCQAPSSNVAAGSGRLVTSDGVRIAYSYLEPIGKNAPVVILLHMLNRDKEDYAGFARRLNQEGFAVIAIDFRGHGQSDGDWKQFSADDFNNMVRDVGAAKAFLAQQSGVDVSRIGIVGASIGANIALRSAFMDAGVKAVVMLSPGLEYRGVRSDDLEVKETPVLLVAAEDDDYSAESVKVLGNVISNARVQLYGKGGHGTQLFETTDVEEYLVGWLKEKLG